MHTRQHEVGQENAVTFLVFNAIERYEKRYGFVHVLVLSINCHHYGCVKLTMLIDAPGTVERSIPLEKSLSTN